MKRKIIQIAGSTQLISLPRKWCIEHNIKKGEELEVDDEGDEIVISTKRIVVPSHIILSHKTLGHIHPHFLSAAYHAGYEEVDVEYRDPKRIQEIKDRLDNCIGYEMINQGEHICQIRAISRAESSEFDQILRKTFYLTKTMGQNTIEVLKEGNYQRFREIISLEKTCDRLTDFCIRVLNQHEGKFKKKFLLRIIVSDVERIGDELRKMAQRLEREKRRCSKQVIDLFQEVFKEYDHIQKLFYKLDATLVGDMFSRIEDLEKRSWKYFEKGTIIDQQIIHSVLVIINILYESAFNNVEVNLETTIKPIDEQ